MLAGIHIAIVPSLLTPETMTAEELVDPAQNEHTRAAVLEKADKTGLDKLSEVTVFAIPLFHQGDLVQLVYLPVPAQNLPGEPSKRKVPQKVRDYAQKAQVQEHACNGFYRSTSAPSMRAFGSKARKVNLYRVCRPNLTVCGSSGARRRRVSGAECMTWDSAKLKMSAQSPAC